jgi:hypothetical protein
MDRVEALVAEADRYAAALMAATHPAGWEQTQNVVARAYAEGRRDGYAECARSLGIPVETANTGEAS